MKFRISLSVATLVLVTMLAAPYLVAQDRQPQSKQTNYFFLRLGSLGGSVTTPNSINDVGWVTGASNLDGDANLHAVLWLDGAKYDLGTLGGPNSAVLWPVHNNHGMIAGVSDTSIMDPLGETWSCGAFFPASHKGFTCQGFVWQNRAMTTLPTLGGSNGFATGVSNNGTIVGWAETAVHDSTCTGHQVLQFEPVTYNLKKGQVQIEPLPTLDADPDGAATAINDKGQIVGISGTCGVAVGGPSATRAVLWQNGAATEIPNLGGAENNTPMAINNRGQVVGFSDLPGDDNGFNAFYWSPATGTQNLGLISGDFFSEATGINNRGQIVGESCNSSFSFCTAVIWQNGVMTDLNSLVPHGSLYLFFADDINSSGEIAGVALNQKTGQLVGYIAVPTAQGQAALRSGAQLGGSSVPRVEIPEGVRQQLRQRIGPGHLGAAMKD